MSSSSPYRDVTPREAEELVFEGAVDVLDVRTPVEYRDLGHIPGALLLPIQVFPAGLAALKAREKPLLVHCEHGVRSATALRWLDAVGISKVAHLSAGLSSWSGPRDFGDADARSSLGPSSWIGECAELFPQDGTVLDAACGSGRHALLFAAAGFRVVALDRDEAALGRIADIAGALGLPLETNSVDLERGDADLGTDRFSVIIAVHYLHRPLFAALIRALEPGGLLIYETFTTKQAALGKPTNPDFLLEPGELPRLVEPLEILRSREGRFDGREVASIAARKAGT